ncbi:hypothetical protein BURK2_02809 [Burkholderiales bacterium]|nr:MAG: hypothetical protein F9K47_17200 [Burkholderiales bacterium]CAG0998104.1 hypothetical protein BURK2_02809 [Burkholderiales bacterium]
MRAQTSAIARLQGLPRVFRGSDLTIRFQWTSKTASQYLYLWKRRGLVQSLGGHSDVYANLLTNADPDWEAALLAAMPSAVLVGIEVLRQAGWTTQVPHRPTVAVDANQGVFTVKPFEIVTRDPGWFVTTHQGVDRNHGAGLPGLRPAWALADLLRAQGWGNAGLAADDVDWSQVTVADEADWRAARAAFGQRVLPLAEMR